MCSQARGATALLQNAFGLRLLHLIGRSYVLYAREWLAAQSASGIPDAGIHIHIYIYIDIDIGIDRWMDGLMDG